MEERRQFEEVAVKMADIYRQSVSAIDSSDSELMLRLVECIQQRCM